MLQPVWKRRDKLARTVILVFSIIVFAVIVALSRIKLDVDPGFDVHLFALLNAMINSTVAILLIAALAAVKNKRYELHKRIMLTAMILSVLFLISYICHHLLAGDTRYGDLNHDGVLSESEKLTAGPMRNVYFIILITHIPLAAIILPFILFTVYRGLTGDWVKHRKLARITWPIWLYVAISGVVVYWMISPYY
jgi:putative membrane protein